ncbi:LysR family transcriptional regulator [Streptomyces sp. TLI_146]|uniref:LysR family transcriptional regulator n=1 Tax=Streptomyces sp. TLI_146 TaxID=1938858 RepID=UPI000C709F90|nr:LysR family transcriptional regulator [Streptomyces sp. TLI_146]PKV85766.1 LysR family transcriptional regulator [Streptomyces sp. TLI_146]
MRALEVRALEVRELECFLVLADELHFGRTGERLYVSQSRVSQLLAALERRLGARLVERTSRRVRLTPFGEEFLAELRPAYDALAGVVSRAQAHARGLTGTLRIGFQGTATAYLLRAIEAFRVRHPDIRPHLVEIPLCDPFGALRRGDVDTAVVLLPVAEPDLELGPVFSEQRQTLAVSVRHPYASRDRLSAAELAGADLIAPAAPAPSYWRAAQAPGAAGGPSVATLQEGLTLVAADIGAMLLCRPTADYHARDDIAFVPVDGLPDSALGVVWRAGGDTAAVRAFAGAVAGTRPVRGGGPRSGSSRTPAP